MIGFFGSNGGASTMPPLPVFQTLVKGGMAGRVEQFKKRADIQNEIKYFTENVGKVKTTEDFFKNYRFQKFALTAFDLEEEAQYPARSKQVMMSDTLDPRSLVNKMTSPLHREIALAFAFYKEKKDGESFDAFQLRSTEKLRDPAFVQQVVDRYVQAEFEQDLGATTPSVSEALYFRRRIQAAGSTFNLIGDGVMLGVVLDGTGIPRTATALKPERLKGMIEAKFDLARAKKDQAYLDNFLNRFIVMRDLRQMTQQRNPLLAMFEGE